MKTKDTFLIFMLLLLSLGTASAQVTMKSAEFSASNRSVTVTYDLITDDPVYVTLYYSLDRCNWNECITVSDAFTAQSAGTNKQIVWNNFADNVRFGRYYFKVESSSCAGVLINGVCWARTNLAENGQFATNDYDGGALYQWGRQADGHEFIARNTDNTEISKSLCFNGTTGVACGTAANTQISNLDANGQPSATSGAKGLFIRQNTGTYDWRTPLDNALWNSGDEVTPSKNAAADPCPAGWRVPTQTEFATLTTTAVTRTRQTDYKGDGSNISGYKITDNATSASIFLPAAGYRDSNNGRVEAVNSAGWYWSSSPNGNNAYYLRIAGGSFFVSDNCPHAYGNPVRCVQE